MKTAELMLLLAEAVKEGACFGGNAIAVAVYDNSADTHVFKLAEGHNIRKVLAVVA